MCWNQRLENDVCKWPKEDDEGRTRREKERSDQKGEESNRRAHYLPRTMSALRSLRLPCRSPAPSHGRRDVDEVNNVERWEATSSMVKAEDLKSNDVVG